MLAGNTTPEQNWSCSVNVSDGEDFYVENSNDVRIRDSINPFLTNGLNVSTDFKRYSNFTANITITNFALDYYKFFTNASGIWLNNTVDISGVQYNATEERNITGAVYGEEVCWYYWANDTAGNADVSNTYCFIVQNTAPVFSPDLVSQSVAENSTLIYDINCSEDIDNNIITYYINDTSKFSINDSTGLINWTPNFTDAGVYWYNVTCGDDDNVSQVFNITVSNTNRVPNITSIAISPVSPNVSSELNCTYTAEDLDLQSLTPTFDLYVNCAAQGIDNQILLAGNTSRTENWSCSVNVSDGEDWDYDASSNVTILGLDVSNITCQINGGAWENCSNVLYYENITNISVDCGDLGVNATFNLTNVYDGTFFVYENTTTDNPSGKFVLDNDDVNISDSGYWNLSVVCEDAGVPSATGYETFFIPFGNLTNAVFVDPSGSINVTQHELFNITTRVECEGGECVLTNATLDPEPVRKETKIVGKEVVVEDVVKSESLFSRIWGAITGMFTRESSSGTRQISGTSCTCNSCSDCNSKMLQSNENCTDVTLSQSISTTGSNDCISIGSNDDVTFDCAGYSIIGGGGGTSNYGIAVSNGKTGATIENCNISEFGFGIWSAGQSTIQYNHLHNAITAGIISYGETSSYPDLIIYNNITDNDNYGIEFFSDSDWHTAYGNIIT